jgi:hypothetical protein
LTGLAELADTRAILDHQVREQWERQQPALARVLWRSEMAEFIRRARREGVPFRRDRPFTARRSVGADGIRARRSLPRGVEAGRSRSRAIGEFLAARQS